MITLSSPFNKNNQRGVPDEASLKCSMGQAWLKGGHVCEGTRGMKVKNPHQTTGAKKHREQGGMEWTEMDLYEWLVLTVILNAQKKKCHSSSCLLSSNIRYDVVYESARKTEREYTSLRQCGLVDRRWPCLSRIGLACRRSSCIGVDIASVQMYLLMVVASVLVSDVRMDWIWKRAGNASGLFPRMHFYQVLQYYLGRVDWNQDKSGSEDGCQYPLVSEIRGTFHSVGVPIKGIGQARAAFAVELRRS